MEGGEVNPSNCSCHLVVYHIVIHCVLNFLMYLYSPRSPPRGITVLQEGYRSPPRGNRSSFATFVFSLHIYIYCACDHSSLVMLVHHICMSPALLCMSVVQSGNAEQCALAFIHLLSSSCTSYFYNISYMFVLIVNA